MNLIEIKTQFIFVSQQLWFNFAEAPVLDIKRLVS